MFPALLVQFIFLKIEALLIYSVVLVSQVEQNDSFLYMYVCVYEKAVATHSSTLAWKISWMEEPCRLYGVAKSRTRLSNFTFTFHFHALEKEMAIHSSVLAWRIPGAGECGGLPSMGSHKVGDD